MKHSQLIPVILALSLVSCATTPPEPLAGNDFMPILPHTAQSDPRVVGTKVRWGGIITRVKPGKSDTCFHIVSHTLDDSGRPLDDDRSDGRFIACANGFFDPTIYAVKRQITVIGILQVPSIGHVGDMSYVYPRVAASVVYLWPKDSPNTPYEMGMDPYWNGLDYPMNPWMGPAIGMPW